MLYFSRTGMLPIHDTWKKSCRKTKELSRQAQEITHQTASANTAPSVGMDPFNGLTTTTHPMQAASQPLQERTLQAVNVPGAASEATVR